jgi:hypothetical protein
MVEAVGNRRTKPPPGYVTPKYYYEEYGGRQAEPHELPGLIEQAQMKMDAITFRRIVGMGGIDHLPTWQRECVMKAMCYIVDHIAENGYSEGGGGASSYSVFDLSVTEMPGSSPAASLGLPPQAYSLLMQSGLMCRRL